MKHTLRGLAVAFFLFVVALSAGALSAVNPVYGYSVDLPVGWVEASNEDPAHIGFLSPNGDAMIQIISMPPGAGADAMELAAMMLEETEGTGEPEAFEYHGRSAALSDIAFTTGGLEVAGYMLTINDRSADYVLLAFATLESYELAHDHLLSAIDSFALGEESRLFPGPVSQYFYPFPAPNEDEAPVSFLGTPVPFAVDPGAADSAAVLIAREARILQPYGALDEEVAYDAWRRYFRQIYRDNYMRLAELSEQIDAMLEEEGVPRVDYPHEILAWLQGFTYERTGTLSDLQAPISCIANTSGDCDSLGLTYVILLHHLGFDAILMASNEYAHALAAVDVQGPGARFEFEGKNWLVAELTEEVALGQIAANMADPAGWIGVRLRLEGRER